MPAPTSSTVSLPPLRGPQPLGLGDSLPAQEQTSGPTALYATALALWMMLLAPFPLLLTNSSRELPQDPDLWWHLRDAQLFLENHAWMVRDGYSYTAAGASWINHEWLAELPFYAAWRLAGAGGVAALTVLLFEFISFGVLRLCLPWTRRTPLGTAVAALSTMLGSVLATVSFAPRTLLFGWACLVFELLLLRRFASSGSGYGEENKGRQDLAIFLLPLVFACWINLHGSWLIGMVFLAVFLCAGSVPVHLGQLVNPAWTRAQRKQLGIVLALSLAALFVNPYGWRLVAYPFDLAFHQQLNVSNVEEWQPLNLQSVRGSFLIGAITLLALAQLVRPRRWTLCELAFAGMSLYAACRHARFLFLAGIVVAPLLSHHLQLFLQTKPAAATRGENRPLLRSAALAAMILFALAVKARQVPPRNQLPVAAVNYLRQHPLHGRLFHDCLWGGYLAYELPQQPVFIDSRMDIYERNGTLRDYLDLVRLNGSLDLLSKHHVGYVLFQKQTPLVSLLTASRLWHSIYDDGQVVLLARNPAGAGE